MDTKEPAADSGNGLADPPARADGPPADLAGALEAIAAERDRLVEEKKELLDQLKRRQADFENFRRRAERERGDVVEFAHQESVRAILPILDDFERALKSETADKAYARGMELIYQRFFESLKKLGLEPITAKGQKFDPHLHHAVDMVETDEVEDHTILDEYQPGYNFHGRLLRPAMVKVAVTRK
ncbi:MAG TPA: nucleotide exchange factor GrpE [Bryobacteraceae bacterium]|nr:nucleotide exchange factor GrpE [Bryobacteraceae bacterium]